MKDCKDCKDCKDRPQSLTNAFCRTVVAQYGKMCKLSNQTVDCVTEDLLTNGDLIETSNKALNSVVTHTPTITFAIASAYVFGFVLYKVYSILSPEDSPPNESSNKPRVVNGFSSDCSNSDDCGESVF